MEYKHATRIDKVMEQVFARMGVSERMYELRAINSWEDIVGRNIALATESIDIYNRTLFVRMKSAAVKSELMMLRTALVDAVNRHVKRNVIDEVVIR